MGSRRVKWPAPSLTHTCNCSALSLATTSKSPSASMSAATIAVSRQPAASSTAAIEAGRCRVGALRTALNAGPPTPEEQHIVARAPTAPATIVRMTTAEDAARVSGRLSTAREL